jgi:hypothetical protein
MHDAKLKTSMSIAKREEHVRLEAELAEREAKLVEVRNPSS